MTTMNNVKRAMEIINTMAPMLEELNQILLDLDSSNLDSHTKAGLDNLYRELNDAYLLYDINELLEEAEEIYGAERSEGDGNHRQSVRRRQGRGHSHGARTVRRPEGQGDRHRGKGIYYKR